jgi:Protein of unknown function (DUF2637)
MGVMGTHARLTDGQRRALAFAVVVVIAGMGMGFASSFVTLYGAAQAHRWSAPYLLPLSVDSGIVAYVVLDHLAVTLGARSRWLHLAALGLAAFTVWANAAVSTQDGAEWRVIHAAMPALWVLGVEALRFMWRHLHRDPSAAPDRIPRARWFACPLATPALWRRMKALDVTSWQKMAAMEEARLHVRDRIKAAREADAGLVVPGALARVVRTGRLPAVILDAVLLDLEYGGTSRTEAAAEAWTDARLTLRESVTAALHARRRDIARSAGDEDAAVTPAPSSAPTSRSDGAPAAAPTARTASAKRRAVSARATDEELADLILPLLDGPDEVKKYAVNKAIKEARGGGVRDDRAGRILELAQRKHRAQRVVPIGDKTTRKTS